MNRKEKAFLRKLMTVILISALSALAFTHMQGESPGYSSYRVDIKNMNVNNISTWFRNNGAFNSNIFGNAGFEWPRGANTYARYVSGLWLGAKVLNETLITHAFYDAEYLPGYIDDEGNPQGREDTLYRIYNIYKGDTLSYDYVNWPVSQGAYVNSDGNPYFLGTQTMFYCMTDGYPDMHNFSPGNTDPLNAQVLQTNWAYNKPELRDVIFTEFRIINRSSSPWNNAYFGFWTDDDVGEATDDGTGVDTLRDLIYVYNYDNFDPQYGASPPCVGTVLLRSPVRATGNANDTVRYYHPPGSLNLKTKSGYAYTGLNVFIVSFNQYEEPGNYVEAYRFFQGLRYDGASYINPVTGQPTVKLFSGDPVTGTGWINTGGDERRVMASFGNVTVMPNDTQSVIVAQIIARGTNNLNSITRLRELCDYVKSEYDNNFQNALSVHSEANEMPSAYSLKQNYPNPFNPSTTITFEIPENAFVSLKIFDLAGREVETLVNARLSPGKYNADFNGENYSSGVYFYSLESGKFRESKRMVLLK